MAKLWFPWMVSGLVFALVGRAVAQPHAVSPEYDFQWATIGAPGNRATLPNETPFQPNRPLGAVGYTYRMATTEVTGGQWLEFVRAYAPYVGAEPGRVDFTSGAIIWRGYGQGGVPVYSMDPVYTNRPIEMGWRYAARYANWLHNDKALAREAFETGAYDTSTFGTNPDGSFTDVTAPAAGARFWIPTLDEWIKAAYYDPNRYGAGQEGYWYQPGGQATPLTSGPPNQPGAQTSAGYDCPGCYYDVGSYPATASPWGLLDVSGGVREWTSLAFGAPGVATELVVKGTRTGQFLYELYDGLDFLAASRPYFVTEGLRIAAMVPTPSTVVVAVGFVSIYSRRRNP